MNEKNIQKIFSDNLIKLLKQKECTQSELASYIGVSNTTINNYVKGYNMPRMDKIDKIAEFFNISRSELINSENTEVEDPDIRVIQRARRNMSTKDKDKMMELLKLSFDEYFDEYES